MERTWQCLFFYSLNHELPYDFREIFQSTSMARISHFHHQYRCVRRTPPRETDTVHQPDGACFDATRHHRPTRESQCHYQESAESHHSSGPTDKTLHPDFVKNHKNHIMTIEQFFKRLPWFVSAISLVVVGVGIFVMHTQEQGDSFEVSASDSPSTRDDRSVPVQSPATSAILPTPGTTTATSGTPTIPTPKQAANQANSPTVSTRTNTASSAPTPAPTTPYAASPPVAIQTPPPASQPKRQTRTS